MEEKQANKDSADAGKGPDTGLICLVMLARYHNIALSQEQLTYEFSPDGNALTLPALLLAARKSQLKARIVKPRLSRLEETPLPAIALDREGDFFILARTDGQQVLIHDPLSARPEVINIDLFAQRWSGQLILLKSSHFSVGQSSRFDFTWFIPAIVKYRKMLTEVLVGSFALQLFALVTPLFFQVVMDKVLVHHGLTTLDVIATGLLLIMLFETALSRITPVHSSNRSLKVYGSDKSIFN